MSATTPLRQPSTKPRVHSSLPVLASPVPKTPRRRRDPATTTGLNPLSHGSPALQRQESDTAQVDQYNSGYYEDCVRRDLNCRVFVDFEVFMKHVLHTPDDWKTRWGPAIDAIKADATFSKYHEKYCGLCEEKGTAKENFYPCLMEMANAALDVIFRTGFEGIPSERRQYYHVNNPNHIKGGVMNKRGLSPDLVLLHKDRRRGGASGSLHWANPLQVLEVKPYDNALCVGRNMPRLVVDETDPIQNHATPPVKLRYQAKRPGPPASPTASTPVASRSRKRPADSSSTIDPRVTKRPRANSVSCQTLSDYTSDYTSVDTEGTDEDHSLEPESELQQQVDLALQACRYLWEMLSVPPLRSHATVSLANRDRLQLYHADRSVILVSSAINFSNGDGKDKFIATIIAFHCLSLGTLETRIPKNPKPLLQSKFPRTYEAVQQGRELHFSGNAEVKPFKVKLVDAISYDPAMIVGRSTLVLNATSSRWPDIPLVVEISWPTSGRVSETDFLKKANAMAVGDHAWAANHLPRVFYAEDVAFTSDPTLESVGQLFEDANIVNGKYVYERRTLRIIIQERLHLLESLTNVRDIGQVFLDIACVHRWLYDCPGILHRDLSFGNIMYRFIEEVNTEGERVKKVYGVLTDYDLSSWTKSLNPDCIKTSEQWAGTPPYMANELLTGTSPIHLYRHDIESLFHIMLLMSARHTIGTPENSEKPQIVVRESARLPYRQWFSTRDYYTLGCIKGIFFSYMETIELSPVFEDFRPWLYGLQYCFSEGFRRRPTPNKPAVPGWLAAETASEVGPPTSQFDDETLGGYIKYATFIRLAGSMTGELEGLVIRYPTSLSVPGLSIPADVIRTNN